MKNFKKVISAVIALAISVSSFAAVGASSFTDVADTASYAQAVDVLSSLGIVSGYEDGTFKPEGSITRAEAATMIVGALNMTEDAKASAGTSQFADVNTQASWASGYINVGVAQGFISGMDATTFAPQENVTYAQMCVMLTSIAGYGDYAGSNGGYPTGYTNMAASTGINKGVAVSNDTALTRGQVAQMIYNTLVTPVLGVAEYSLTGNTYSQLDGKSGRDFKTLLSDKFDGYVVTAIITDAPKAQSGAVENDEVKIEITKADWWEDTAITSSDDSATEIVLIGNTDAGDKQFQSGTAIIIENDDDEYELVYFAENGKTETKELDAADYVKSAELSAENQYESNGKVRFGSTYYKLANEVEIYANGVSVAEVDKTAGDNTTLDTYLGGAQGTVKLVKLADDTNYSKIFVDYYIIGEVTSVTYKSNTTTVNFAGNRDVRKIVIDDDNLEAGDTIVTAKKGDAEIELKDIAKDDIIAVAYNPEEVASNTLTNPSFLTVLATNDTASGKVAGKSTDDETYTIDGKVYGLVDWDGLNGDITVGNTYTLTLDPFGRIYAAEMDATSKNIAVVEKWNSTEEKVTLVLGDGTSKTYEVDCSSADITSILYSEGTTKARVQDRVVEYTVKTSTGAISRITKLEGVEDKAAEYKDRSGKLGSFSLSDATQILNAEKYVKEVEELEDDEVTVVANGSTSDYAGWTKASLTDGSSYKVYAYNKTSDFYSFVIITKAGSTLSEASRFAVVKTAVEPDSTTDGYECASITALYGGEEVKLYIDADEDEVDLDYGDAFYFELDSDGLVPVANIYKIYDHSSTTFAGVDALAGLYDEEDWFVPGEGETCFTKNAFDVQLVYGIVTGVKSSAIEFGVVKDNKIDGNKYNLAAGDEGIFDFDIASDCVAYEYDTTSTEIREKNKIDITSASSILASDFSIFENEEDDLIIDYVETDGEDPADYANYAVAMVVDGSIVAIYSIVNN